MISKIIDLLVVDEFYGVSTRVDIAKGRYERPTTWKSLVKLSKRVWYGRKLK